MARWDNWDPPNVDDLHVICEWTASYAAIVHEGYEDNGLIYPARPWTDVALSQFDFEKEISDNLGNSFDFNYAFTRAVDTFVALSRDAMITPGYSWPRTTFRYNGEIVPPGKRNIYDTGELFDSLVITYGGS